MIYSRRGTSTDKITGYPLKLKEIWAIRVRLQVFRRTRELALFDLGIDSKLRACDLLKLRVRDISHGERIAARAIVVQQKTSRPVQFEITESTRTVLTDWIKLSGLASDDFLFPSRVHASPHLSTRQYARIVDSWVEEIGLDPAAYGTHSIRRTKPSLIYRRTKNLRAVLGPYEAREHGSLPWHRGRGRLGVGRADRGVALPG
jgi:integrase